MVLSGEQEKMHYTCEDEKETFIPLDHRLPLLGYPQDDNR